MMVVCICWCKLWKLNYNAWNEQYKNWDSAGTCFGETDFEGEKFKYPGENGVKDITVH